MWLGMLVKPVGNKHLYSVPEWVADASKIMEMLVKPMKIKHFWTA